MIFSNYKKNIFLFAVLLFLLPALAKADSISLSIAVPYLKLSSQILTLPQPNGKFKIDVTASLSGATSGSLSATGCPASAVCELTDSSGTVISNPFAISSIPASATYYYQITTSSLTPVGTTTLSITLNPISCPGVCPATAQVNAAAYADSSISTGAVAHTTFNTSTGSSGSLVKYSTVRNIGNNTLNWTASPNQTWCHVSPTSGSLPAFSSQNITLTMDSPSVAGLGPGLHICNLNMIDTSGVPWGGGFMGGIGASYRVTDSSSYNPTISLMPCDNITLNWNAYPGATGYKIYRGIGSITSFSAAQSLGLITTLESNHPGFTYTHSPPTLINQADLGTHSTSQYNFWLEPLGISAGVIPFVVQGQRTDQPTPVRAIRCGGPMRFELNYLALDEKRLLSGRGIQIGGDAGDAGTRILLNAGDAPLSWSITSSDPTCKLLAIGSQGGSSGTLAPGEEIDIDYYSSVGYNRAGNQSCLYSLSTNSITNPNSSPNWPLTTKPPAPLSVTTENSACGGIKIIWPPTTDASAFNILRRVHNTGGFAFIASNIPAYPYPVVTGLYSYTDTTAASGQLYDYQVHTVGGIGGLNFTNANSNGTGVSTVACSSGDISADSTNIPYGGSTNINWTSVSATSCTVQPTGWTGTSGNSSTGSLVVGRTYDLYCSPPTPANLKDSVTVNVDPPAAYTVYVIKGGQGTVVSSPAGINCGLGCSNQSATFDPNTLVQLTITPGPHRTFTGWGGACTSFPRTSTTCDITVDNDKSVNVNFAVLPQILEF